MTVDDGISNPSTNRPFDDVLAAHLSRRAALVGGAATAALAFFGSPRLAGAAAPSPTARPRPMNGPLIGFAAAPNPGGPNPTISADYDYAVIIPWGSPLQPGGPDIDGGRPASEAEALAQVGMGHDGMHFFPKPGKQNRGVLCINHEYGDNTTVLGKGAPESLADVRLSQATHGASVIELQRQGRRWDRVRSNLNRRITPNTPVTFDGPVAGHPLLDNAAGNAPAGTVNNCANGVTPWGTYLTCEENFNGYFGANGGFTPTPEQARYGLSSGGFGYGWHVYDERWDLTNPAYANEANRFGWVVEIDPWDPSSTPVKHTALGRVKHEGIALTEGKGGRVVGYMGDDERFDYIYKFVSADNWQAMRGAGKSPLSEGQLYVARFNDDGTGDWLELTISDPALAAIFADQAEVLTYARAAADALGATPMDRPEWTAGAPAGPRSCTQTNNTRRTASNAANPLAPNPDGHIIRWTDADDHIGLTFEWDIFLIARDSHGTDDAYGSPDGLWVDPDGRVFIQTDGDQPAPGNNQMLVADPATGDLRRLFAGVTGDEITGITVSPDRTALFVNTQHPGNGDPTATNFPIPGAGGPQIPRDATFVIWRKDGGIVGS
jgi:secreted PhoX family phosphatase